MFERFINVKQNLLIKIKLKGTDCFVPGKIEEKPLPFPSHHLLFPKELMTNMLWKYH